MYRWFYEGNGLLVVALAAMVFFAVLFVGVVVWTYGRRGGAARYRDVERLPLDDEGEKNDARTNRS
jgi:cbb3-type cytochrome oxidase subunit 3